MLRLDDPRWKTLEGGYRVPYDASVPLGRLERGEDVWKELWQELHHQGDVGEASYAAVPHLVRIASARVARDWNPYALASLIEIERHRSRNPPLPSWLAGSYAAAWEQLLSLGLGDVLVVKDLETFRSILGALALARGQLKLGAWIEDGDEDTIDHDLEERRAWSDEFVSR
ncbi:MAG TPA: hypothetical protein VLT82_09655 [Myxococcaceae bacterium]|nr:hypothetical protein [Myxococcaceae bacterium]